MGNEIKISKNKFMFYVVIIVLITAIYVGSQEPTKTTNEIAATVNAEEITLDELNKAFNSLPPQYQGTITKKSLLDQLIQAKVFYNEAQLQGLTDNLEAAKLQVQLVKLQSGLSDEEFQKNLNEQELSEDDLIDQYKKQISIQNYLDQELLDKIIISNDKIKDYYDDNSAFFEIDDSVKVKHILIGDQNLTDEEKDTKANNILKNLTEDNFCDQVEEHSTDLASIPTCGEYTFTKDDTFVQEFKDLSFKQKEGEMGITNSQFGPHIIWTVEKISAFTQELDEVSDQIKDVLKNQKGQDQYEEFYDNIAKNYDIVILYEDE